MAGTTKKPRLLLLAPMGWSIRNYLWSGTIDTMLPHVDLTIATPIHDSPVLREACAKRGVTIVPMREMPQHSGWRYWVREFSRDNYFLHTGGLAYKLKMQRATTNVRLRARVRKQSAHALSKAMGFLPHGFWQRINRAIDTPADRFGAEAEILDRVRPDLVFSTVALATTREYPFLCMAADRRIPIATAITGFDNFTTKDRLPLPFDRFFLWSDRMRDELLRFFPGVDPATALVTGTPQFDPYFRADCRQSRSDFCKSIGAREDLPLILYSGVAQSGMPREPESLAQMAQAFADGALGQKVQLVYRPHPKAPVSWYADTVRRFPDLIVTPTNDDEMGNPAKWSPTQRDVQLLVSTVIHSAVNLNITSTMSLDAAVADLPVVNFAFDDQGPGSPGSAVAKSRYDWEHYRGVVDTGAVSMTYSLDELCAATRRYLTDRTHLAAQRRALVNTICGPVDGHAGQRVVNGLLEMLGVAGGGLVQPPTDPPRTV